MYARARDARFRESSARRVDEDNWPGKRVFIVRERITVGNVPMYIGLRL